MFADVLGLDVLLTDAGESGALGAAMCAAVAAGLHDSLEDAAAASVRVTGRLEPNPSSQERLEAKYAHYHRAVRALGDVWDTSTAVL